jgi:predicted transcriptional regulator
MTDIVSAASETVTLTVKLPRDLVKRFQALIARTQWDLDTHVAEALTDYIPNTERRLTAIQQAIEALDAGAPTYSNEEVIAWMESWGTEHELPAPDERDRPG